MQCYEDGCRTCDVISTDLRRKPVFLGLLFFSFLSFTPRENIQDLVSDVFLLCRILFGLAAPEFPNLSASVNVELIPSCCKG